MLAKHYYPKQVYYIQDNASYHKDSEIWKWFSENQHWLHVKNLPPYCPELNATEHIWHHTRVNEIHNQYFDSTTKIFANLEEVFDKIQSKLKVTCVHFYKFIVRLIMRGCIVGGWSQLP